MDDIATLPANLKISLESKPIKKRFWTADELLAADFPEPKWIVPGLLMEGLTLLAGRPKLGKSFLALQIAHAVSTGGVVLGRHVEKGRVLYLALEDSPRRLKQRLDMQGLQAGADMTFAMSWEPVTGKYNGMGQLQRAITSESFRLIVIDTIGRITTRIDGDSYSATTDLYGLLQSLTQAYSISILAVDHHRKGGGFDPDAVDDVMGSTGKVGAVDSSWGLYRQRGKREAKLQITGRDLDEQTIEILFDRETGSWQVAQDEISPSCRGVLAVLRELESATLSEVANHLQRNRGNIYRELNELEAKGLIFKDNHNLWSIKK